MHIPRVLLAPLTVVAGLVVAASQCFVWVYAPLEQTMGLVQKIFYIHVPLFLWAMISFFVVCVASICYLYRPSLGSDRLARAAAEVGVLFCSLALVTGSIWARHSWNVWWSWDPRLITALIMFFVYVAYLLLRGMDYSPSRRTGTACAVLGIIAFLDVPLVFYSARLWRSIHPMVFASRNCGLEPEMRLAVVFCVAAWAFLWLTLVLVRQQQLEVVDRLNTLAMLYES